MDKNTVRIEKNDVGEFIAGKLEDCDLYEYISDADDPRMPPGPYFAIDYFEAYRRGVGDGARLFGELVKAMPAGHTVLLNPCPTKEGQTFEDIKAFWSKMGFVDLPGSNGTTMYASSDRLKGLPEKHRVRETGPRESDAIGYGIGEFLYHVSPKEYEESILEDGISPRTGGTTHLRKEYSPRIYLATSLIAAYDLSVNFTAHRNVPHAIFKVDSSFLEDFGIDYEKDPDFMHGIYVEGVGIPARYVLDSIDPDSLEYDDNDLYELYEDAVFERLDESLDLDSWLGKSVVRGLVYHGTDTEFFEFDPKKGRDRQTRQQLDFGSHFTVDEGHARVYSKTGKIVRAYIRIERPLDLTDGGNWIAYRGDDAFQALKLIYQSLRIKPIGDCFYDRSGKKMDEVQSYFVNQFLLDSKPPAAVRRAIVDAGFDGVIYEPYVFDSAYGRMSGKRPRSFIVFDKSQIRILDETQPLKEASRKALVVCDVQPHDVGKFIKFKMGDFARFVNAFDRVLVLYNGDSCGWESEGQMQEFYFNIGIDLDKCEFFDKGYGFFRELMDSNVDDDAIVMAIKALKETDEVDSRDLSEEEFEKTGLSEYFGYEERDDYSFYYPYDLDGKFAEMRDFTLVGGGKNECLRELRLMLDTMDVKYRVEDKFTY